MKRICLFLIVLLTLSTNVYADSAGYGCWGPGIVAWDEISDRTGLHFVLFGTESGISTKFRVQLPRGHGSYSQGISCEPNKVSIMLRGEKTKNGDTIKFLMYVTEISVTENNGPIILSDTPNHYQIWKNHRRQSPEPLDNDIPIVTLNKARFWLDDCDHMGSIRMSSDDDLHRYYLNFKYSSNMESYEGGGSKVTERCIPTVEMRDAKGELVQSKEISDRVRVTSFH